MSDETTIDSAVKLLGPCKIDSPLRYASWADKRKVSVIADEELCPDIGKEQTLSFEAAGPRQKLYFDPIRTKAAIVTCGGLCPGLNEVIRSIVMECYHAYNMAGVIGIRYGLEGFIPKYGHRYLELTPDLVKDIHRFGGTLLGSSRGPQDPVEIVDTLERSNVNALFIIGGDGTMRAGRSIYEEITKRNLKIAIVGVPKTIDNDISFIPKSFGFETAVFKATEAISCAHTEALGIPYGIGIVKLMGRESGFIAGCAALGLKEANFVLVPEAPFSLEGEGGLLPALEQRLRKRKHAVIIVAEGAGQHLLEATNGHDASGNRLLGDIGFFLRDAITHYFATKTNIAPSIKYIDPSYIIRSVPASGSDRVYCGFLGQNAVHAALAGRTGTVIARINSSYVHLPIELVTRARRKVCLRSDFWRAVLESTGQGVLQGMQERD